MKNALLTVALIVGTASFVFGAGSQETKSASGDSMMKSDSAMKSSDSMMKSGDSMMKSDNSMKSDDSMMKTSDSDKMMAADPMDSTAYNVKGLGSQVMAFTTASAAQAIAAKHTVVYFFAATWCPDCMATYKDLKAHFSMIPANLTIVFVDYDKAMDLKAKYGITAQHTFVSIGPKGEKEKVWNGSKTVADLISQASPMARASMKSSM